jgi:hypothetical protein
VPITVADAPLATLLGQLATLGPRFPVTCDAAPSGTWTPATALVDPAGPGLSAVVDAYARTLGTHQPRIAASIALQSYGTRLAGLAIGSWVLFGAVPAITPGDVHVRFDAGRATGVWVPRPRHAVTPDAAPAALLEALGAGLFAHLAPLVEVVRRDVRLSSRRAWGNLAASCAGIFSALDRAVPAGHRSQVRADAHAFFARVDWPVHRLIDWRLWAPPGGPAHLCHERRTCCLMRQLPGRQWCESCSIETSAARQAAWERTLQAAPDAAPFRVDPLIRKDKP